MAFFPKRMASLGSPPATSRIQLVTRDSVMVGRCKTTIDSVIIGLTAEKSNIITN